MRNNYSITFLILSFVTICFFFVDLTFGSIHISLSEILSVFFGKGDKGINAEILLNFRLPKAITAW